MLHGIDLRQAFEITCEHRTNSCKLYPATEIRKPLHYFYQYFNCEAFILFHNVLYFHL